MELDVESVLEMTAQWRLPWADGVQRELDLGLVTHRSRRVRLDDQGRMSSACTRSRQTGVSIDGLRDSLPPSSSCHCRPARVRVAGKIAAVSCRSSLRRKRPCVSSSLRCSRSPRFLPTPRLTLQHCLPCMAAPSVCY
jgi:hypothetical protein